MVASCSACPSSTSAEIRLTGPSAATSPDRVSRHPTQAEPRGGRIVVGYGRDAADVAFITNYGPLTIEKMQVSVEQQQEPARGG